MYLLCLQFIYVLNMQYNICCIHVPHNDMIQI